MDVTMPERPHDVATNRGESTDVERVFERLESAMARRRRPVRATRVHAG